MTRAQNVNEAVRHILDRTPLRESDTLRPVGALGAEVQIDAFDNYASGGGQSVPATPTTVLFASERVNTNDDRFSMSAGEVTIEGQDLVFVPMARLTVGATDSGTFKVIAWLELDGIEVQGTRMILER